MEPEVVPVRPEVAPVDRAPRRSGPAPSERERAPGPRPRPISASRADPIGRAWLRNRWEELAFVHWEYDPAEIQRLLPDGLRVDVIDGSAWVSLIPFRMADAAPNPFPAVPWLSRFAETNVRTYVVDSDGDRAIWFFSLEADRLAVVALARAALGFPYVWSSMELEVDGARRRYATHRRRWPRSPPATTTVELEVGVRIAEPTERDVFLSARWGTVARWRGRLRFHPVDHDEWHLHQATLLRLDTGALVAAGLSEPAAEPLVRWAEPVDARFGVPRRV
ncbi:YqjF family protein [Ilumatobacter sp.]|uniref:YqjF family protein n=1 Tax=Ilumatobacter sp. TaxID=1967498 RepID=UPI003B52D43E